MCIYRGKQSESFVARKWSWPPWGGGPSVVGVVDKEAFFLNICLFPSFLPPRAVLTGSSEVPALLHVLL